MLELRLERRPPERAVERLLVVWESRERRWAPAYILTRSMADEPFLRNQEKIAKACLAAFRKLYPRRRFRLQPVGAKWLMGFYDDLVLFPDDPDREWFERWGGGSLLWQLLGRQPYFQ